MYRNILNLNASDDLRKYNKQNRWAEWRGSRVAGYVFEWAVTSDPMRLYCIVRDDTGDVRKWLVNRGCISKSNACYCCWLESAMVLPSEYFSTCAVLVLHTTRRSRTRVYLFKTTRGDRFGITPHARGTLTVWLYLRSVLCDIAKYHGTCCPLLLRVFPRREIRGTRVGYYVTETHDVRVRVTFISLNGCSNDM